jgi:hypothetical protein
VAATALATITALEMILFSKYAIAFRTEIKIPFFQRGEWA